MPFSPDSEEEVRVAMAQYFTDLGFGLNNMSFEDSFQIRLGHNAVIITKPKRAYGHRVVSGRSDMLLAINGKPLAIVETKAPSATLGDADRDQALSYARLLREMAPYTIVTNGSEVRVYDTYDGELIASGSPVDAVWWRNGQSFGRLPHPDLRVIQHTLVTVDVDALRQYCRGQVAQGMVDLVGTPQDGRRYSRELYVNREDVEQLFREFLGSEIRCFAVTGESGIGKTNVLCHLAETTSATGNGFALFYWAERLWQGLTEAIRNDFNWEFDANEPLVRILQRFGELVQSHGGKLIIFIDGLDEYREPGMLRGELIELVQRLDPATIRLCLSCKSHNWDSFIRDRGEQLNVLGQSVFPPSGRSSTGAPGFELQRFIAAELDFAWPKYRAAFNLSGELQGETRRECHFPLMLRLVSEAYTGSGEEPPAGLADVAIFGHYWQRRLSEFGIDERLEAEAVMERAAEMMVSRDEATINESLLYRDLNISAPVTYDRVIRLGLLVRHGRVGVVSHLSFPFDKLRSYVYCIQSRRWPVLDQPEAIRNEVIRAMSTRLGCDALLFYLTVGDTSSTGWLAKLLPAHVIEFANVMTWLEGLRWFRATQSEKATPDQLGLRLARYIATYSELRAAFSPLKTRLIPYTRGDAGLWICGPWHGFRTTTVEYPQPIVGLPDELAGSIFSGRLDETVRRAIRPNGGASNTLWHDLETGVPEYVAWSTLSRQLAELMGDRILDELDCPAMLVERIHSVLHGGPSFGVQESPAGRYAELIGYKSVEEARSASIRELTERVHALVRKWSIDRQQSPVGPLQRWYDMYLPEIIALEWYLEQLGRHGDVLPPPGPEPRQLFAYLEGGSLDETANLCTSLAPIVLANVTRLLQGNLPQLQDRFAVARHSSARLLLEISYQPEHSDYLQLAYVLLPSLPAGPVTARVVPLRDSLAEVFIVDHKSAGNIFAEGVSLETDLDDQLIRVNNAVISRVRYPDECPVLDQVYQLIANEAELLFGDRMSWASVEYGGAKDRHRLVRLLAEWRADRS